MLPLQEVTSTSSGSSRCKAETQGMAGCLTSKMSMDGWWMVHTTVRPVFTVLRTAQEGKAIWIISCNNEFFASLHTSVRPMPAVMASSAAVLGVTCPHDNGCSSCIQARGGLILHMALSLLRLHHKGIS